MDMISSTIIVATLAILVGVVAHIIREQRQFEIAHAEREVQWAHRGERK